jgi:lipopolysaccharide transport system permease protein
LAYARGSAIAARMSVVLHSPIARPTTLDFRGDMSFSTRQSLALKDIAEGLRLWPLARSLGWLDIRLRYRGSALGPFWLTISSAVMIVSLGVLYSALFHTDVHDYLPFLALSQMLWFFLAAVVGEACTCFTQAEGMILTMRMPLFLHALRVLVRNVLVLAHNVIVIVGVYLFFDVSPGWRAFMAAPGAMLWIIDSLAICLLLGTFCTRYRDIGPIVGSVMQIAFFLSPIIWQPQQLGQHAWLLPFNPFYALMEIVRAPLLGTPLSAKVWIAAVAYSLALCTLAWALFVRARGRVAFWI